VKDITDLFDLLLSKNFSIKAYNLFEFWSDLGTQKSLNKIKKIK
jgi:NDP-sugar pyrophosphorylase family protein